MNESYEQSYKLYQQGREAYDAGEMDKAISLLKESNELYPHFKTLELWGNAEIHMCNFKNSITPLAAATTLNSGVKAPSLLASAYLALKDKENSEKFAKMALDRDPNNKQAKNVLLSANKI